MDKKIKFNTDLFSDTLADSYPEPFPEIWELMQYPHEKFISIIKSKIQKRFDEYGIEGVYELRDENLKRIEHVEDRLNNLKPKDDEFKVHCAKEYFQIFNSQIYKMESGLAANRDKRVKHGEKEAIQKYWDAHKENYLTDKYRFELSGYLNRTKIARDVKEDGKFLSHIDTIKDHAGLNDLE